MMLDTIIGPIDADLTWQEMDPTFCESDLDYASEVGSYNSDINLASDDDDFDSDDDNLDSSDHHPVVEQRSNNEGTNSSLPDVELDSVNPDKDDVAVAASAADLPEVIQRFQKQLLAGYAPSIYPAVNDPRGCELTPAEKLSLKHYLAWVDSHGTVKGYHLHAQILQEATQMEILSLYLARKLAVELTGLSSQLMDMCPKNCMTFTGDFKDLLSRPLPWWVLHGRGCALH